MGRTYERITDELAAWMAEQKLFFVATAPDDGFVNLSPKGYDTFRILAPDRVAYLDLTGSGAETLAHVRQNQRITFLFCGFGDKPNLVRLYGRAEAHQRGTPAYEALRSRFPAEQPGARAVIEARIERVSSSCGYSVPFYTYEGERPMLDEWAERRGEAGVAEYWAEHNVHSIDGLPALDLA